MGHSTWGGEGCHARLRIYRQGREDQVLRHTLDSGWGRSRYPCVMGHEIVDVVIQAGHKVKDLQVGDHVSIGALVSACLNKDPKAPCSVCASGNDAYCPHRV
ncbi:hypothetical protein PF007_g23544 [Phytophthora fragariae]|uniref:Alcohol dehydrogenase-like N-terminal domain-containing protein n=1 Tax=Phytophthora fragariae TaxID=53985 RepID=A0A6A3QP18_9STRA|nr:hypothetical protein PF011_g18717 [Phytophthora fragariae]KAE9079202.1 hypothetical protein PF007_g23544 [Phytophthora fragariae]